jgi:hypothetical protein
MAMATSVQAACTSRPVHLTQFTPAWLMTMRCRRASRALSRDVTSSRWAVTWPSFAGFSASALRRASTSEAGVILSVT